MRQRPMPAVRNSGRSGVRASSALGGIGGHANPCRRIASAFVAEAASAEWARSQ
jgi:hypothetical protein